MKKSQFLMSKCLNIPNFGISMLTERFRVSFWKVATLFFSAERKNKNQILFKSDVFVMAFPRLFTEHTVSPIISKASPLFRVTISQSCKVRSYTPVWFLLSRYYLDFRTLVKNLGHSQIFRLQNFF